MPKFSISLPGDLAVYAQAEGQRHPRGLSGVIAEALANDRARASVTPGGASAPDNSGVGHFLAAARHALEVGNEREARIERSIIELLDIVAELAGTAAADHLMAGEG